MELLGQFPDDPFAHVRLGTTLASLGLPKDAWLKEFGAAFVRCYEAAAAAHGKARWADKAPENAVNVPHWEKLLGQEFFFVSVVRHPFDVVASMREARMDKVLPRDLAGKARHVARYMECAHEYAAANGGRSIMVRYEELVRDPEATLASMLQRIGEPYDRAMIDNLFSASHGSGLEDPKVRRHRRITAASVGRWKRDFGRRQIRVLAGELAGICERFDYGIER
jgi:hypothetical protein